MYTFEQIGGELHTVVSISKADNGEIKEGMCLFSEDVHTLLAVAQQFRVVAGIMRGTGKTLREIFELIMCLR